ncbi:hypothetical protein [Mycobacterium sp. Lab-001]|uniref:hypothetical protein n=1 Tax=Mycobacterium sp. Lab-001 TaxID=3410136 RepID=UPI003D16BC77
MVPAAAAAVPALMLARFTALTQADWETSAQAVLILHRFVAVISAGFDSCAAVQAVDMIAPS